MKIIKYNGSTWIRIINSILILSLSLLIAGGILFGCEGPAGPPGERGPQGEQGSAGEPGPQGEQGNANVTLYKFDGHDFSASSIVSRDVPLDSLEQMVESTWLVQMAWISSDSTYHRYHMPGFGQFGDSEYRIHHRWEDAASVARFFVILASGAGEEYDEIHIIRIEATDAEDYRTKTMGSANSSVLDVSDYEEVVEYFSLNRQRVQV